MSRPRPSRTVASCGEVARVLLPISRRALPHHIGRASSPIPSGAAFALPRSYRAQTCCVPNSKRCATRQMSDPCTSHTLPSSSGRVLRRLVLARPASSLWPRSSPNLIWRGLSPCAPSALRGIWGVRPWLPPVGWAHSGKRLYNFPVSGLQASLMGIPASTPPPLMSRARGSATLCSGCWVSALLERLAPSWLMPMA
jgi:hypothetical protein